MGLADLIARLGGRRAMYDEDPILRRRMREEYLELPDLEEKDGRLVSGQRSAHRIEVEGEPEVVGSRRRLSTAGRAVNEIPGILRGVLDGMSARRTGTALDLVSGAQAAMGGAEERDLLGYNRARQMRQDQMNEDLHRARIEEYQAQAERERAQAQAEMQKPGRIPDRTVEETIAALMKQGYSREEAASIAIKQWHPNLGAQAKITVTGKFSDRITQDITALDREYSGRENDPEYQDKRQTLVKQRNQALEQEKGVPFGQGRARPDAGAGAVRQFEQGAARLQLNPKTGRFEWVLDEVVKPTGERVAETGKVPPKAEPRPPKDTASDKRYRDQSVVRQYYPSIEAQWQKDKANYPNKTTGQMVEDIMAAQNFKNIPGDVRPLLVEEFLKRNGGTRGAAKSRINTGGGQRPAQPAAKDPLNIR